MLHMFTISILNVLFLYNILLFVHVYNFVIIVSYVKIFLRTNKKQKKNAKCILWFLNHLRKFVFTRVIYIMIQKIYYNYTL